MDSQVSIAKDFSPSHDLTRITLFVNAMIAIQFVVNLVAIAFDIMQYNLLAGELILPIDAFANDIRQKALGYIYLATYGFLVLSFSRWIYLCCNNCVGFGVSDMTYSPGWSVGHFFIPFTNFYKPLIVMKELWQASSNPAKWREISVPQITSRWWIFWIISAITGQTASRLLIKAETIQDFKLATIASILTEIIVIFLHIFAFAYVAKIYKMQNSISINDVNNKNDEPYKRNEANLDSPKTARTADVWLAANGMGKYSNAFAGAGIDFARFREMKYEEILRLTNDESDAMKIFLSIMKII